MTGLFPVPMHKLDLITGLKNRKCELIGVIGRHAFHIFDKTHATWISHNEELGYVTMSRSKMSREKIQKKESKGKKCIIF